MLETGLAAVLLPEIVPGDDTQRQRLDRTLAILEQLAQPSFPLALGTLLHATVDPAGAQQVCRRWRLSNKETVRVGWLVEHVGVLAGAGQMRWSQLQPILISDGIEDLLALHEAASGAGPEEAAYCRSLLARPPEELDPPPLATGNDLLAHGVPSGPRYRSLLDRLRCAQLDGEIGTRAEALAMVDRLISQSPRAEP